MPYLSPPPCTFAPAMLAASASAPLLRSNAATAKRNDGAPLFLAETFSARAARLDHCKVRATATSRAPYVAPSIVHNSKHIPPPAAAAHCQPGGNVSVLAPGDGKLLNTGKGFTPAPAAPVACCQPTQVPKIGSYGTTHRRETSSSHTSLQKLSRSTKPRLRSPVTPSFKLAHAPRESN